MQMRKNEQRRQAAIQAERKIDKDNISAQGKMIRNLHVAFNQVDNMFAKTYPHMIGKPRTDTLQEDHLYADNRGTFKMRMHEALPKFPLSDATMFDVKQYVSHYDVIFHKITAHIEKKKHRGEKIEYLCTVRIGDGYKTLCYAYSENALEKIGFDKDHLSELITQSIYTFYNNEREEEIQRYGFRYGFR